MADQSLHQQLDELKKKLAQIEHLLKSPDGQGMIYFVNIENADVKGPVVDKLEYTFDKLDVKEVSGALNLGNNFGVNVEKKGEKKKQQEKNPASQSHSPSQKQSEQHHKNLSVSPKKEKENNQKQKQNQTRHQGKPLAVSEKTKQKQSETNSSTNTGESHREQAPPSLDVSEKKNQASVRPTSKKHSGSHQKELKSSAKEDQAHDYASPRKKPVNKESQIPQKHGKPLKQRLKKNISGRASDQEGRLHTPINSENEKTPSKQNQQRKGPIPKEKAPAKMSGHSASVDQTKTGFSIKFD